MSPLAEHVRLDRPGRVVAIDGIVFQADADDLLSVLVIGPIEHLSRWLRGRQRLGPMPRLPLANHAGIRVRVLGQDGQRRTYVIEQQTGTLRQHLVNGLVWTPWQAFKAREGGGWDVTVPVTAFVGISEADVSAAIEALNDETGRPFYGELCTNLIERVFGGREMFGSVEVLDRLVPGPGPRIPEPAAPLLRPDAKLSRRARALLRVARHARPSHAGGLKPAAAWAWLVAQGGRFVTRR